MRTIYGEFPLQTEIPLFAGLRVGRDDRHEQRTFLDLSANGRIPGVAPAQLALVEPHLEAGRA
ncbi:MAG TPA: hypothetical protein VIK97_04570, partial [Casimicrobiaceae bacterium]